MNSTTIQTRRNFIKNVLLLAAGLSLAGPLDSFASVNKQPLSFYHTHTGEQLKINFSRYGCKPTTLKKLNTFLRDFRTGEVHSIDPELFAILCDIKQKCDSKGTIEIISGYRSPKTNALLRSKSNGVAKRSLHMKGKALDIRLTDISTRKLRDTAISLQRGGVGYYAKSDFVHIDTGRFRVW
jgi:uncharacterized protein YcbK (DUF882 family)